MAFTWAAAGAGAGPVGHGPQILCMHVKVVVVVVEVVDVVVTQSASERHPRGGGKRSQVTSTTHVSPAQ